MWTREVPSVRSPIESQMTALIAATLQVDAALVGREATIAGALGADSLDFVVLILAIEDEFQVDIPDEEAAGLLTVGHLIDYVTFELASRQEAMPSASRLESTRVA
jgi:acyl carrier protein